MQTYVYTSSEPSEYYPSGFVAIVCASRRWEAVEELNVRLREMGLPCDAETIERVDDGGPCVLMCSHVRA